MASRLCPREAAGLYRSPQPLPAEPADEADRVAILVSRGMKVLPSAPAAYPYRSAWPLLHLNRNALGASNRSVFLFNPISEKYRFQRILAGRENIEPTLRCDREKNPR